MIDFFALGLTEASSVEDGPVIYRAEADPQAVGLDANNNLVVGMRLSLVHEGGYNLLDEEISNIGTEVLTALALPEGGLVDGQLYTAKPINLCHDRESGVIDSWDIGLFPYHGEVPTPAPSVFDWDAPSN